MARSPEHCLQEWPSEYIFSMASQKCQFTTINQERGM
jgi:hypothetical protein